MAQQVRHRELSRIAESIHKFLDTHEVIGTNLSELRAQVNQDIGHRVPDKKIGMALTLLAQEHKIAIIIEGDTIKINFTAAYGGF